MILSLTNVNLLNRLINTKKTSNASKKWCSAIGYLKKSQCPIPSQRRYPKPAALNVDRIKRLVTFLSAEVLSTVIFCEIKSWILFPSYPFMSYLLNLIILERVLDLIKTMQNKVGKYVVHVFPLVKSDLNRNDGTRSVNQLFDSMNDNYNHFHWYGTLWFKK